MKMALGKELKAELEYGNWRMPMALNWAINSIVLP